MSKIKKYITHTAALIMLLLYAMACANMASPTGGDYDEDPPKLIRSTPVNNELNFTKRKIEILFDENIKIEKPAEKVIITPPQIDMPVIKSIGRKAVVELNDELKENTTYTIDFTDAIVDNNESNPLENFSISFSTGDVLDTLAVSGVVLTAENLEPAQGIYVGIHTNLDDTAFTHVPFERISRTDSRGRFTVRGLAPGEYNIFALDDTNRDYKYDNPQEAIAFLDSIIVPSSMPAVRQDTIFKDSITIDSIHTINYTRFIPDDIILRSFSSDFQRKYLQKHERPARERMFVFFSAPTERAEIELLQPAVDTDWMVLEPSLENDTLAFWITDTLVAQSDTILMKINYLKTDSLNLDQLETDTLRFTYREPRQSRRERAQQEKEEGEEEKIEFLKLQTTAQGSHDIYKPIYIEFEHPVVQFDSTMVQLEHIVDSIHTPIPFVFTPDSVNPRKYKVEHKWEFDQGYQLAIDSAAVHSVYGLWNNKYEQKFSIKAEDQYGNLMFNISGLPQDKTAYVELLDASDKPFRKIKVKDNRALIFDITPGKIYARLFIDDNEDGEWTTGDYATQRQPEMVYYYPREYEVRAYTDHEEMWNLNRRPLNEQKPLEITKNKPEEKKQRNLNEERNQQRDGRGGRQSSSGTGSRGGGMGAPRGMPGQPRLQP